MNNQDDKKWWFYQDYEIVDQRYVIPKNMGRIIDYDPFDYYGVDNREDLYLTFANLNLDDLDGIQSFYNKFGPLGLIARSIKILNRTPEDIEDIIRSDIPDSVLGIYYPEIDDTPLPLTVLRISEEKVREWEEKYLKNGIKPSTTEVQKYAREEIVDFNGEHKRFTGLLELYFALAQNDPNYVRHILQVLDYIDVDGSLKSDINGMSSDADDYLDIGIRILMDSLNNEVEKRAYQQLRFERDRSEISREYQWKKDSLLTAFYIMFIHDSISGKKVKKCANCNRFYNLGRPQTRYCSYSCQNKAKTRKYRQQKKVMDLFCSGLAPVEIAKRTKQDIEDIKKVINQNSNE